MEFSRRLANQQIGYVRKITDEANKLNRNDKIFLSIGIPDFPILPQLHEGLNLSLDKGYTKYTPTAGLDFVRESIAKQYENRKTAFPVTKDNILMTAGSQEAIFLTALGCIEEKDEVIVISPSFFTFRRCSAMMGAKVTEISYEIENSIYRLPLKKIQKTINEKTKFIYINSPNNPTGAVTTIEEIKELVLLAKRHNIYIVSDEVYKDFVYDIAFCSPFEFYENTIIVDSISKSFSASGLRIGWLVANETIINKLLPAHQQIVFSLTSTNQFALHHALEQKETLIELQRRTEEFKVRYDIIWNFLYKNEKLECPKNNGAFYFFPKFKHKTDVIKFCYDLMYEEGIIIVPGIDFGEEYDQFFRIAYTQKSEDLIIAVQRIGDFIKRMPHD